MSELILVERDDAVATITFNRPDRRNALNRMMAEQLRDTLQRLDHDTTVRCVVLRGAGGHFTAGQDLTELQLTMRDMDPASRRLFFLGLSTDLHAAIRALHRMAKPVIASVAGTAAGFGFSLTLAADLAIAAEDARFEVGYTAIGASPNGGLSHALTRLIGERRALGTALDGSQVDATTALAWGLVNTVVAPETLDGHTRAYALRLAAGPTLAFAHTKALIRAADAAEFDAQLEREAQSLAAAAATDDFAEGLAALLEKRAPRFRGR